MLVRADTRRLLRSSDLSPDGDPTHFVVWDETASGPLGYDPMRGRHAVDESRLALRGQVEVATADGPVTCFPAFELVAQECRERPRAAQQRHPDHPRHNQLSALTGNLDEPGGNVLLPAVATNDIEGAELLEAEQAAKAIGVETRPLGPARYEFITGDDFYTAALEGRPYRPRGLVNFGANLVMAHGDSARGRDALAALDFFVHADLFMTPTAEQADVVLPVASAFEVEGMKIGFEINEAAQSLVQLRAPLVQPRGEARSDLQIIFALAPRLGLGAHFWDGDLDAAWRHQLAPSGVTLE